MDGSQPASSLQGIGTRRTPRHSLPGRRRSGTSRAAARGAGTLGSWRGPPTRCGRAGWASPAAAPSCPPAAQAAEQQHASAAHDGRYNMHVAIWLPTYARSPAQRHNMPLHPWPCGSCVAAARAQRCRLPGCPELPLPLLDPCWPLTTRTLLISHAVACMYCTYVLHSLSPAGLHLGRPAPSQQTAAPRAPASAAWGRPAPAGCGPAPPLPPPNGTYGRWRVAAGGSG